MIFEDLVRLYEEKRKLYREETYRHLSEIFREAEGVHLRDWSNHPTKMGEHGQSWRSFKGHSLEKLILYVIRREVEELGLRVASGDKLEKTRSENLSFELSSVKRKLLVDYGEFGAHLPDADLIIYKPTTFDIVAIISSKVTLRERIAETGYWKIKLSKDRVTERIRVLFVTLDEDRTLAVKKPAKKGRAIVEVDTDGSYVMSESPVQESPKVKMFGRFISDLRELVEAYDK
jgi:type II restriction enzyme